MTAPASAFLRVATLKSAAEFCARVRDLGLEIPCDEETLRADRSPLAKAYESVSINGRRIGNRLAIQPMEGWDGTHTGGVTAEVNRRWQRFAESGAKLICGGEAMAVRPDGRANTRQLILSEANLADLAGLVRSTRRIHRDRFGQDDDLVIGFQLTHSGRFCKPWDDKRLEPRVAYRHPILDRRFGVVSDAQVFTDDEVEILIGDYVKAARLARAAGADFVDIKHCHGYLLHEFLSAHIRAGRFGGGFENRTRILREIVAGIRADRDPIDIGLRLSAFDFVPFRADPALSQPGHPGPGIPEPFAELLPYRYGFGLCADNPLEIDLAEPKRLLAWCADAGIKVLSITGGSPYYNPHIQRPAAYPPSDGYLPPEDPLIGVARHLSVTRSLHAFLSDRTGAGLNQARPLVVGSAYSYLQEFLPRVAQAVVAQGWTDAVGVGRMVLSYPRVFADAFAGEEMQRRLLCRTLSDCTTAPRNGMVSGCYPLDSYYAQRPEADRLKELKRPKRNCP